MEVTIELQLSDTTIALPEALLGYEIYEDSLTSSQYGIGSSAIIAVPEILLSFRLHDYGLGGDNDLMFGPLLTKFHQK